MISDMAKIYKRINESSDYDDLYRFLREKEHEVKYSAMPDYGCGACCCSVDENGHSEAMAEWLHERNLTISKLFYEQAEVLKKMGRGKESFDKYVETRNMLENNNMTDDSLYKLVVNALKK